MNNPYSILSVLAFIIYTFLAAYVVLRNISFRIRLAFLFMYSSMAVWSLAYAFVYPATSLNDPATLWFWYHLSAIGWSTVPATALHFTLAMTDYKQLLKRKTTYIWLYLPGAVILYQALTGYVMANGFYAFEGIVYESPNLSSIWIFAHPIYLTVYFFLNFYIIATWMKNSDNYNEHMQAKIIIVTGLFTVFTGFFTNLAAPALGIKIPAIAHILALVLAIGMQQAIVRYRFLSISYEIATPRILEYIGEMVFITDKNGLVTFANQQAMDMTGHSMEELQQIRLSELASDPEKIAEELTGAHLTGQSCQAIKTSVIARNKDKVPVSLNITPVFDHDHFLGYVAVIRDLTPTIQLESEIAEKSRIERALRESEARYREIVDNTNDLIYVHDFNGTILSINPAATLVTGYSQEELLGSNIFQLVLPEDRGKAKSMMMAKLADEQVTWYELAIQRKNGERLDVEVSTRLVLREGVPVAVQGTGRDITERKQMEERMRYFSMHDAVTGLYNRAFFNEEMTRLGSSRNLPIGLIICDMDGLKLVNDYLGHDAGDRLLVVASELIHDCFRQEDIVARLGGDEFGIILPSSGTDAVSAAASRVLSSVQRYNDMHPPIPISISVGWAVATTPPVNMNDLFRNADNNMYKCKYSETTFAYKYLLEDRLRLQASSQEN